MQFYDSISLRNAWWNVCCPECGEPMADNPYRNVKITWSEILSIAIGLWGPPDGFFVRDFLVSMEFLKGRVLLAFCSQGPRRGEVEISVPTGDEEASELKKAFMDEVRAVIEAVETSLVHSQTDYYDDEYLKGEEEGYWD